MYKLLKNDLIGKDERAKYLREHIDMGVPISRLAKDLGINRSTLHKWIKKNNALIYPKIG